MKKKSSLSQLYLQAVLKFNIHSSFLVVDYF